MSSLIVRHDGFGNTSLDTTTTAAQTPPKPSNDRHALPYSTDGDATTPAKREHEHVHVKMREGRQKKVDKQSPEYLMKSMLAGGIAGSAAKTVVGPLDRVKILFQTRNPQFAKYAGSWSGFPTAIRDIYTEAGVAGLFKGHSATLLRIFPYAGIKFLAYEQIRAIVIPSKVQETPARRFISGSLAGMASVFCTYPLEVIRVRLAFETKVEQRSSLTSIIRKIYNETAPPITHTPTNTLTATASTVVKKITPLSGLSNFFRGFTPTLIGMVPYAGASFLAHDTMSDLMRHPLVAAHTTLPNTSRQESAVTTHKPAQLRYWAELSAGGVAGFVSQTISYPLEVVRRRMQVGGVVGDGRRLGIAEVAKRIYMERGMRGFFVGLTIGYIKVVPMVATSFYVYERGKYYLGI